MMKKIGVIGLGRMGLAIAQRLLQSNIAVIGFDLNANAMSALQQSGGIAADIKTIAMESDIIWLMLPAGTIVDTVINELTLHLQKHAIIIDGGNSFFKDSIRRHADLATKNIFYLDCGTSGGLHGERLGYCLMIGGDYDIYQQCTSVFEAIAMKDGYAYLGPAGAGHYVKMVHNGIEYALLQSYAEGMQLLKEGYYSSIDLEKVASVWQQGSIIRSWIVELMKSALKDDQQLKTVAGTIGGGQTGTWTYETAKEFHVDVPMLEEALKVRAWSQKTGGNYATKLVAVLRHEFGGHAIDTKK